MWTWSQRKGEWRSVAGDLLATGYSGHGAGRNEPSAQHLPMVGPIPIGAYQIGVAGDHPTKGPLVMALLPHPANQMFGRSGFLVHGDSIEHPGEASEGCIILPKHARSALAGSIDRLLVVLP